MELFSIFRQRNFWQVHFYNFTHEGDNVGWSVGVFSQVNISGKKKRRDLKAPVLTLAVGIGMAFIDTFPNPFIFGTRGVGAEKVKALAP